MRDTFLLLASGAGVIPLEGIVLIWTENPPERLRSEYGGNRSLMVAEISYEAGIRKSERGTE